MIGYLCKTVWKRLTKIFELKPWITYSNVENTPMKNLHRDRIEKITQYYMVKPIVVC